MKTCELSFIKYLLFIFNLIFAISGIGLIVAGALVLSDVGEYRHFMEGKILAPPVVLIIVGCIVFLVASLGCYGAIRESYYMLMAFAVCLLAIFIIELAVGIAAAVYKNDVHDGLRDIMKNSLSNYEQSKADKIAWDNLQTNLQCCGVNNYTDWPTIKRPMSCCDQPTRDNANDFDCKDVLPSSQYLHIYGCFDELQKKAEGASKVLIGVGIGIAFVEIIGIILACWMASAIKNRE